MTKLETDTLSFRLEPRIKRACGAAAARDRRTPASMVEVIAFAYCLSHGINVPALKSPPPAK